MSEIPGLGQVPHEWRIERAKWLMRRKRRAVRSIDGVVTAFRDGQVTLRSNRREEGFTQAIQEIGYQGIRRDDVVVHGMDGFAGAIGVSDSDGKASPVVHVYVPAPGMDARFIAYSLRRIALGGYVQSLAKGIRERSTAFDAATLADVLLPAPPLDEQRRIADFLDAETSRIDRVRSKINRAIDLVNERQRAAVDRIFTPSSSHADEVWEVLPLRRVVARWIDYRGATPEKSDSGVPLITAGNIKDGAIDLDRERSYIADSQYSAWMRRGLPRVGDVLLTTEAPLGEVAMVNDAAIALAQRIILMRVNADRIQPSWLYWYFRSSLGAFELLLRATGSTAMGVKADRLRVVPIPVPNGEVVKRRLAWLREVRGELDEVSRARSRQLALLAERRQALITAAVTGQLDVTTARSGVRV